MSTDDAQPVYTVPGVVDFLLTEWRRWERERALWEKERASLQERISKLEGERLGHERVKGDLVRRVKMLEHALRQERMKASGAGGGGGTAAAGGVVPSSAGTGAGGAVFPPVSTFSSATLPAQLNTLMAKSTLRSKAPHRGSTILKRYLEELGATEDLLGTRAAVTLHPRSMTGPSPTPGSATSAPLDRSDAASVASSVSMGSAYSAPLTVSAGASVALEATYGARTAINSASSGVSSGGTGGALSQSAAAHPTAPGSMSLTAAAAALAAGGSAGAPSGAAGASSFVAAPPVPAAVPDGGLLSGLETHAPSGIATNSDGVLTMWTPSYVLRTHLDSVRSVAFTANHPALLSASDDGTVKLWNLRKLARGRDDLDPVFSYRGHQGPVLSVAVNEQRSLVVSGGLDSTVRAWRLLPAASHNLYDPAPSTVAYQLAELVGHTDAVWETALHETEPLVVSASADGTVRVWQALSESPLMHIIRLADATPTSAAFTAVRANLALVGDSRCNLRVVDVQTGQTVSTVGCAEAGTVGDVSNQINKVAAHPTLPLAVTAHESNHVKFVDVNAGKVISSFVAHPDAVSCVAVDPSGLYVASGGHDGSLRFWDISRRALVQEMPAHHRKFDEGVLCVAYHASKTMVASGGADSVIKLLQ